MKFPEFATKDRIDAFNAENAQKQRELNAEEDSYGKQVTF